MKRWFWWKRNGEEKRLKAKAKAGTLPAEDFYGFISYTNRDLGPRVAADIAERYCRGVWEWGQRNGIRVFFDRFSIDQCLIPQKPELKDELASNIRRAHLVAVVRSDSYLSSEWCRFEASTIREMKLTTGKHPVVHAIEVGPRRYGETYKDCIFGHEDVYVSQLQHDAPWGMWDERGEWKELLGTMRGALNWAYPRRRPA